MCDQFWIFNYRCLHSVNFANVVKDVKDVIGLNDVTNVRKDYWSDIGRGQTCKFQSEKS